MVSLIVPKKSCVTKIVHHAADGLGLVVVDLAKSRPFGLLQRAVLCFEDVNTSADWAVFCKDAGATSKLPLWCAVLKPIVMPMMVNHSQGMLGLTILHGVQEQPPGLLEPRNNHQGC